MKNLFDSLRRSSATPSDATVATEITSAAAEAPTRESPPPPPPTQPSDSKEAGAAAGDAFGGESNTAGVASLSLGDSGSSAPEAVLKEGWLDRKVKHRIAEKYAYGGGASFGSRYFVLTATQLIYYDKEPKSPLAREQMPQSSLMLEDIRDVEADLYTLDGTRFIVRGVKVRKYGHSRSFGSSGGIRDLSAKLGISSMPTSDVDLHVTAPTKELAADWLAAIASQWETVGAGKKANSAQAWTILRQYLSERGDNQLVAKAGSSDGSGSGIDASSSSEDSDELPSLGTRLQPSVEGETPHAEGHDDQPVSGQSALIDPTVPVPKMTICIIVVGTRGDVNPFAALGQYFASQGHRVRLATHACYREDVVDKAGLEFYPLAGDPKKLSEFMVKTGGRIIPDLMSREERSELPVKMKMVGDIIQTCWPACTEPDPEDPMHVPFIADAIISNPVSYAHIHCAEGLGIPLHLMFPQPWTATKAFPHPFSQLSYSKGWSKANWVSYFAVEEGFWTGTKPYINRARVEQMGIEPIRTGELGAFVVADNRVPWTFMWSAALCPKPKDWPEHVGVAGNFFLDIYEKKRAEEEAREHGVELKETTYEPAAELKQFLENGEPPIFIGFGSMVIADTNKLTEMIVQAATDTKSRILIQSSWSDLRGAEDAPIPDYVYFMGGCPHDWLFQHVAAVIHHGGAGTTAAGLRYGRPTMICPFFGDQYFWGEMVRARGCGPSPVPITEMTREKFAQAFTELRGSECKEHAQKMAEAFATEDGVVAGYNDFFRNLPLESMVCQASLFCAEPLLARVHCEECDLDLSVEVIMATHSRGDCASHKLKQYKGGVDIGPRGPTGTMQGIKEGGSVLVYEVFAGVTDVVREPMRTVSAEGVLALPKGIASGLISAVRRPIQGTMALFDKIAVGTTNEQLVKANPGAEGMKQTKRHFMYDKYLDLKHDIDEKGVELLGGAKEGGLKSRSVIQARVELVRQTTPLSTQKKEELCAGLESAVKARKEFLELSGGAPLLQHAKILQLVQENAKAQGLPAQLLEAVLAEMDQTTGLGYIAFPNFCVFRHLLATERGGGGSDGGATAGADSDAAQSLLQREASEVGLVGPGAADNKRAAGFSLNIFSKSSGDKTDEEKYQELAKRVVRG